jgi:hypothetical protein
MVETDPVYILLLYQPENGGDFLIVEASDGQPQGYS